MTWGSKNQEGMVSVAHVMRNRADSMAYGNQNGGLMKAIVVPKEFSV
jgi:spore germination cell wall hydrolase CwlJ-like protein